MKTAYSFKQSILNGEVHIFKGKLNIDKSCNAENNSLCGNVSITQGKWHDHSICLEEEFAQKTIDKIGSKICAICNAEMEKF